MDNNTIYTSYFAQIRNMPESVETIAISKTVPDWYNGKRYEQLAPPVYLISEAHKGNYKYFEEEYNKQLDELDIDEVVEDLLDLADDKIICLVCYEKAGEFCHRNLVSKRLRENGYASCEIDIEELEGGK